MMVKTTKRLLPSFLLLLLLNKEYYKTGLIPPPSVGNWNLKAGDRKEGGRGGREGSLQISAISQPDYLLAVYGHYSSFPLDGGTWGVGDLCMGIWAEQKKLLKERLCSEC